jgi:hypothetical protein
MLPLAAFMRLGYAVSLVLQGHRNLASAVLRGVTSALVGRPTGPHLGLRSDGVDGHEGQSDT